MAGGFTPAFAQIAIDLGSAGNFAVLAGSAITFTGATTITGDIGTHPTTTITGVTPTFLSGSDHGGDSFTQTAKIDLLIAYNAAAGSTPTTTFGAIHDLGGQTLTPGVYNDPSSFGITGTLTLNANGNVNAVWIFQAGSTLITQSGSQVLLIGGAQAANVFWQVGTSATFLTSSVFVGNVLADTSITVGLGSVIDGRVLAINGAVTFDGGNTIAIPAAIPEPAATAALAAGLMALLVAVRRFGRRVS